MTILEKLAECVAGKWVALATALVQDLQVLALDLALVQILALVLALVLAWGLVLVLALVWLSLGSSDM